jgi:predicted nucleic acid-binding protein
MLEKLALSDSEVDDDEKAILSRVFARISETTVSPEVWQEVCRFKTRYQIP